MQCRQLTMYPRDMGSYSLFDVKLLMCESSMSGLGYGNE